MRMQVIRKANNMQELAIVIPAYKKSFFFKALQSLALQTCKDFTIYIGDDCSPDNLEEIVRGFYDQLDITYTRFEKNIGSLNIVDQWKRCVDLSQGEKWVWLFSDDDIADTNCVKNFYDTKRLLHDRFDVYRFNTCVIDSNELLKSCTEVGPQVESSEEMAYYLLLGKRGNSMPDHIFRKKIYDLNGGFVFTRFAQAADWATSILFSKENGICVIPDAILYWRVSEQNISSFASKRKKGLMYGHFDFIHWLLDHFQYLKVANKTISYEMIEQAAKINLISTSISHYKGFSVDALPALFNLFRRDLRLSAKETVKSLLTILINSNIGTLKIYNLLTGKK